MVVVALLAAASIASAQVEELLEYNFLGAGARANGMGDAFIGVADDATAIFWNPAGLFLLDQPETSFGFRFASGKVEQDRGAPQLLLPSDDPGASADLSFASFVYPARFRGRKLVFAFALQKSFDFNSEFEEVRMLEPLTIRQGSNSGGPFSYSGAVALTPFRGLMLGASVNVYRGSAQLAENEVAAADDRIAVSLSVANELPVNGTSFGLGALYDFQQRGGPTLRVGAKLVPAFDLSGDIRGELAVRFADSQGIFFERTAALDYDYVLDFPLDLGIGVAWNPRRDLLVAGDFEHRRFRDSALRVFDAPNVEFDEDGNLVGGGVDLVNPLSDSGSDLNQWRAGLEWSWVKGLTVIPIRAGVKNLPQVTADESRFVDPETGELTTSFDEQVVGTAITAGAGFVTDSFVFDMSMEYGGWRQEITRFDGDQMEGQDLVTRRFGLKVSLVIYF